MDHSAHQNMDHSAHQNMDHSAHQNMDHSAHHNGASAPSNLDHDHDLHQSFFHATYGSIVLFKGWLLHDAKSTFLWCLFLVVLAIAFQLLKFVRHKLGRKCANLNCRRYILNKYHLVQTFLYMVQFVSGYLVMLAVMTYNAYVCVAAIFGLGLGYFFFGWGEYEDGKRNEMRLLRKSVYDCRQSNRQGQELEPLSKDVSVDTLLTNVSTPGVACSCNSAL